MKSSKFIRSTPALLAIALLAAATSASAYDFTVTNGTEVKIVSIEATEDGKTWGKFNIGAGLVAGASMKITWDASTEESVCEWKVRASYADGSEAAPAAFDFCEKDLKIEFTE